VKGFDGAIGPDGKPINVVSLTNSNGSSATFMDWGATWLSCQVVGREGFRRETLVHCATFSDHLRQKAYLGSTIGRFANRINAGQFVIEGELIQLATNDNGNTLHGGPLGFDNRRWEIDNASEQTVTFSLLSPDGDQGFPGTLRVTATYTLGNDNSVSVSFEASTEALTPVSLTNHAYFNLDARSGSVLDHSLQIDADCYLPVDRSGIPTGQMSNVDETRFDFRRPRGIGYQGGVHPTVDGAYDHAYQLNSRADTGERVVELAAVSLWSSDRQLRLDVFTDMPAVQLYTASHLNAEQRATDEPFEQFGGVALETAFLPDAPNRHDSSQPSCFLQPSDRYHSETRFRFAASG
jgi:aldose 1-epimerase